MQNPRLAARYAKSLLDLAIEKNSLEDILKDMQLLNAICIQSRDFAGMLRSPVISSDRKLNVITEVLKSYSVNALTTAFINLLVTKGRELNLPEIAVAFLAQYNTVKHIRVVKLTTATKMDASIKSSIEAKIAGFMPTDTMQLETAIDEQLIGGFVLEVEDKLYDASVRKHLTDIKTMLVDHTYESKI